MTTLSALNDRYAIAGQVTFEAEPNGLVLAKVRNPHASAQICLQGAQVIQWAPLNEHPVIWLSKAAKFMPGKSVRGGVPVCWPWFGPHASDTRFPAHGYARTVEWDVIETAALADGRTLLVFRLRESAPTREQWPHDTPLECRITVGDTLEIELSTKNNTDSTVTITEALHTYFEIGDIGKVSIAGLEDTEYLDKVDGGQRKLQHGPVTIAGEVDRVYLDTRAEVFIEDLELQRKIHISKRGSDSTVVWNPWQAKADKMGDLGEAGFRRMVCVESGNAAENTVTIAPGEEHLLWVSYRVERD
ncbi:MAG: D-hexose-6-phosphate mutarotase [Gammaproteobacteria bacterium]|nr:D-hexose-6-phosphate mutarotase [Gammaproteobacteria bacterium]